MKFNEILKKVKKLGNLYDLKEGKLADNMMYEKVIFYLGVLANIRYA